MFKEHQKELHHYQTLEAARFSGRGQLGRRASMQQSTSALLCSKWAEPLIVMIDENLHMKVGVPWGFCAAGQPIGKEQWDISQARLLN